MLSFAAASSSHALASPASCLTLLCASRFPSAVFVSGSRSGDGVRRAFLLSRESDTVCNFSGAFEVSYKGFSRRKNCCCSCSCTSGWDCQGDLALEAEILEFMKTSGKPEAFPSRKELLAAGRMDLVEAIRRQGGWLTLGWDSDDEDYNVQPSCFNDSGFTTVERESDDGAFQERPPADIANSWSNSLDVDSSCSAASSSPRDVADNDKSGIEGILSRLEKERSMNLIFDPRGKGDVSGARNNDIPYVSPSHTSLHATVAGLRKSQPETFAKSGNKSDGPTSKFSRSLAFPGISNSRNSLKPEMWTNWSIQRAGNMESQGVKEADEIVEVGDVSNELCRDNKLNSFSEEVYHNQIQTRLEHLQLELSSVLHSVRSNVSQASSQSQAGRSSNDDLHNLSDSLEFQENEVMNAQDKLRSIRAKLAVLEGKMALAVIDAQKMVKEKQKRIDDARRALQLLRTACIVWPTTASEVLLAGSFDGWATQRKMHKSEVGIFSLYLKLYPGRYEIKFIVDGKWRIDPLRPVVYNNGHENNLLTIT